MNPMRSAMLVQENQRLSMELKEVQAQIAMLKKELNKELIQADAEQVQGRYWLPEEHRRFLVGLKKYGHKNIKAIAAYVGTRSTTQVRSHAQKYMKKLHRHGKTLADLGLPEKSEELEQDDESHPAAASSEESSQAKPVYTPSYDEFPLSPQLQSKKPCYDNVDNFSSLYVPASDQVMQNRAQSFDSQMCSKNMAAMGMAGKDCSSAQQTTVVGMPMPTTNSPSVVLQTGNDISGALRIHKVSWQNVPAQGGNPSMFAQLGGSNSFIHPPHDSSVANFGNNVFPMSQLGQQQCVQQMAASNFPPAQQMGNNLSWLSQQQGGQPMKGNPMAPSHMLSMFQKVTETPMNLQQGRFVL